MDGQPRAGAREPYDGIGRAVAEPTARKGHTPVGVARSAPRSVPGGFYEADLADGAVTGRVLDEVLAAGPVDGVGVVRPAPVGRPI